jgi:hypothetical protein
MSSFSFEENALLQLIEERFPGTLDSAEPGSYGKMTAVGFFSTDAPKEKFTPRTMAKRLEETYKQGAVDSDTDGEDGGEVM